MGTARLRLRVVGSTTESSAVPSPSAVLPSLPPAVPAPAFAARRQDFAGAMVYPSHIFSPPLALVALLLRDGAQQDKSRTAFGSRALLGVYRDSAFTRCRTVTSRLHYGPALAPRQTYHAQDPSARYFSCPPHRPCLFVSHHNNSRSSSVALPFSCIARALFRMHDYTLSSPLMHDCTPSSRTPEPLAPPFLPPLAQSFLYLFGARTRVHPNFIVRVVALS
jgi:hypothetical protein